VPEQTNFHMENKQKTAKILGFISLAILIINMIDCYLSINAIYNFDLGWFWTFFIFTGLSILALIFSIVSLYLNSRQIIGLDLIHNQFNIGFTSLRHWLNDSIF